MVPESLKDRSLTDLPAGTLDPVTCAGDSLVSDGCSVTVVALPSSGVVAVIVEGGFGGATHRVLGPFNRDLSDF